MAAADDEKSLLAMLFTFYTPTKKPLLIIDKLDDLSIDEQLNIIKPENISSMELRKKLAISLFDKVPQLKECAHKRIRFKSFLSKYYKSYIELDTLPVSKWNKNQLPLSFFIYLIKQLQATPNGEKEIAALGKAKKNASSSWKFVYYTLKYCHDSNFQGQELFDFYNEITNFGKKPGGFGLKFVQKICGTYNLKFGKFAKVKKSVGVWVDSNINKTKEPKQEEEKEKQPDTGKQPDINNNNNNNENNQKEKKKKEKVVQQDNTQTQKVNNEDTTTNGDKQAISNVNDNVCCFSVFLFFSVWCLWSDLFFSG